MLGSGEKQVESTREITKENITPSSEELRKKREVPAAIKFFGGHAEAPTKT